MMMTEEEIVRRLRPLWEAWQKGEITVPQMCAGLYELAGAIELSQFEHVNGMRAEANRTGDPFMYLVACLLEKQLRKGSDNA